MEMNVIQRFHYLFATLRLARDHLAGKFKDGVLFMPGKRGAYLLLVATLGRTTTVELVDDAAIKVSVDSAKDVMYAYINFHNSLYPDGEDTEMSKIKNALEEENHELREKVYDELEDVSINEECWLVNKITELRKMYYGKRVEEDGEDEDTDGDSLDDNWDESINDTDESTGNDERRKRVKKES